MNAVDPLAAFIPAPIAAQEETPVSHDKWQDGLKQHVADSSLSAAIHNDFESATLGLPVDAEADFSGSDHENWPEAPDNELG